MFPVGLGMGMPMGGVGMMPFNPLMGGMMIGMQMMQMMQMMQFLMGEQAGMQASMMGGMGGFPNAAMGMGGAMGMPGMGYNPFGGMPGMMPSPFGYGSPYGGPGLSGYCGQPPYGCGCGCPNFGNVQCNPNAQIPSYGPCPNKQQIGSMLDAAAQKYGIPPDILKGIAYHESGWNPNAVGDHGCSHGMMQIYSSAHPDYNVARGQMDPSYNIDYAARMLAGLAQKCGGNWAEAVRRYNGAGPMADRYSATVMQLTQQKPWERWGVA